MTEMNKKNYKYSRQYYDGKQTAIDFEAKEALTSPQEDEEEPPREEDDSTPVKKVDWNMRFVSFGSGSSGNCSYLGNENSGVLIDAGIDPEHVFKDLLHNGVTPEMIKGIVLTHDHADHIRYVYNIVRRYKHIHIYCTPRLMNGLLRHHNISSRVKEYQESVFKEIPFHIAGMTFTAFEVSHDGTDNMGFYIECNGSSFVVATDMGVITDRAAYYMKLADYLMIESNYDREMLDNGHYSEMLKSRVRSEKGHLDNVVAAQFVADNYRPDLKYVFLCHLSNDNNTPAIACKTMGDALKAKGLTVGDASNAVGQRGSDVQVYALPRYDTSQWFVL